MSKPGPQGWTKVVDDAGLARFARLLRDYHDAVKDFTPPNEVSWFTSEARLGDHEVICSPASANPAATRSARRSR